MSGNWKGQPSRDSERVPIDAEVDLEFESFQGFLTEYSANISLGGMFVRIAEPPPVGTVLRFSLKLKGDFDLVEGRGKVAWIRPTSGGDDEPAGAGIQFLELKPASEDLIRRMVDRFKGQGGRPFSLGTEPHSGPFPRPAEAAVLRGAPGESLRDDVFVPPEMSPEQVKRAAPAESPASPGGESPASVQPLAPPSRKRHVGIGTVFLVLAAAVLGGLISHYGERLVHWATGYDKALAERVVNDIPPAVSLASQPEDPAVQEPDQGEALSPEEAGVVDLGPGPVPGVEEAEEGEPAVQFGQDYPTAEEALNRIRLITWKENSDGGGTVVTLWGNGNLRRENLLRVRLGGRPARELVKLKGIDWPFREALLEVDSTQVSRIRTGFHPKETANELHVVFDLKDSETQLRKVELGERSIQLFFGS